MSEIPDGEPLIFGRDFGWGGRPYLDGPRVMDGDRIGIEINGQLHKGIAKMESGPLDRVQRISLIPAHLCGGCDFYTASAHGLQEHIMTAHWAGK